MKNTITTRNRNERVSLRNEIFYLDELRKTFKHPYGEIPDHTHKTLESEVQYRERSGRRRTGNTPKKTPPCDESRVYMYVYVDIVVYINTILIYRPLYGNM